MKDKPDLDAVVERRREAFSPELTTPRIGVPSAPVDEEERDEQSSEILQSTSEDLKVIAKDRKKSADRNTSAGMAVALTVATLIGAFILAVIGLLLYELGMAMDLGSSD